MQEREARLQAVRDQLARGEDGQVVALLGDLSPEEIVLLGRGLEDAELEAVVRQLLAHDETVGGDVLALLDAHDARRVLEHLPDKTVAHLLEEQSADDATWMVELLDDDRVDAVVGAMDEAESAEVRERLGLPEGSAGRLMSDEFLALSPEATAGDAVSLLREAGEDVTIVYVYLTDEAGRLVGVVSLRRLIRVEPDRPLRDLTPPEVVSVSVYEDQEDVARLVELHDFVCVPVVDPAGRLVGVITHDDVIDVLREEATEDILQMAGTSPADALSASVLNSVRLRVPWLLFCLLGGLVSAKVLEVNEVRFGARFATLVVFVPTILGMGGNVGTQSATLVVRGLATGRIQRHDGLRVFWTELRIAGLVGLGYGAILACAAGVILDEGPAFSAVVGLSLASSMVLASSLGTLLPIAFHALRVDPAVATGPLVSTGIDVLGVVCYLTLAAWLLAY